MRNLNLWTELWPILASEITDSPRVCSYTTGVRFVCAILERNYSARPSPPELRASRVWLFVPRLYTKGATKASFYCAVQELPWNPGVCPRLMLVCHSVYSERENASSRDIVRARRRRTSLTCCSRFVQTRYGGKMQQTVLVFEVRLSDAS